MKFYKDKLSLFLFFTTYLAMISQIVGVWICDDPDPESHILYHKIYFVFITFMSLWTHYKCSFTNPGIITFDNNLYIVELYLRIHQVAMKRAENFNKTYAKMFFEGIDEEEAKNDMEDDESEYDETEYEPVSQISEEFREELIKEYKVEMKRCDKCFVCRVPKTQHCSLCKGCVVKRDHHCPWVNNCVGQFNQKFFIQFVVYCFIGCAHATFMVIYYVIYHKQRSIYETNSRIVIIGLQLLFGVIFLIFNICMMNDQWDMISNETVSLDVKKKKFIEKRDLGEVIEEVFGGSFSLSWFLPISTGGYKDIYNDIKKSA